MILKSPIWSSAPLHLHLFVSALCCNASKQALSFFHYFSCVFDFESWALSVETGQPVLKSSMPGASFSPGVVVVLDPVDSNLNVLSSFVVETADAMRVELYRVFQVFILSQMPLSCLMKFVFRLLATPPA